MQYTTGKVGKTVVIRLEDGDPIYESIINVATDEQITHGTVMIIGCTKNVEIVNGPESDDLTQIISIVQSIPNVHEIAGIGTLFPDESGKIVLHMHAALGRDGKTVVGCPRINADCWLINEIVIVELTGIHAKRIKDEKSGFSLLEIQQ